MGGGAGDSFNVISIFSTTLMLRASFTPSPGPLLDGPLLDGPLLDGKVYVHDFCGFREGGHGRRF